MQDCRINFLCCVSHSVVSDSLWPCQAPLSLEFSRQEYWSGLPCPSPGDLPNPGMESRSPASQVDSLPSEPPGNPGIYFWVTANDLRVLSRGVTQRHFRVKSLSLRALHSISWRDWCLEEGGHCAVGRRGDPVRGCRSDHVDCGLPSGSPIAICLSFSLQLGWKSEECRVLWGHINNTQLWVKIPIKQTLRRVQIILFLLYFFNLKYCWIEIRKKIFCNNCIHTVILYVCQN